jgi:acylphosphatase
MNGTVEVVAESTRSQLEELLVILELGPPVSSVLNVDATWSKSTGEFKKFQIRYF